MNAQTPSTYTNITVAQANQMINQSHSNLYILDVRNQSEYAKGHLYDAILVPLYQLNNSINGLGIPFNSTIIVYCASGIRSAAASQILANAGFTNIKNMEGGITAWMQAGYPIDTTMHHVTVTVDNSRFTTQIEPYLLYAYNTNCSCQYNTNDQQTTTTTLPVPEYSSNASQLNATRTLLTVTCDVNGTEKTYILDTTNILQTSHMIARTNTSIAFYSVYITLPNATQYQVYMLYDTIQSPLYNMTILTILQPLDHNTYNNSLTLVDYAPAGGTTLHTIERVDFNNTVTLSQIYAALSKVEFQLGNTYARSPDSNLTQFATRYYIMSIQTAFLSAVVERDLAQYDKPIVSSIAIVSDDSTSCYWCVFGCEGLIASACLCCYVVCAFYPVACEYCEEFADYAGYAMEYGCDFMCEMVNACP